MTYKALLCSYIAQYRREVPKVYGPGTFTHETL